MNIKSWSLPFFFTPFSSLSIRRTDYYTFMGKCPPLPLPQANTNTYFSLRAKCLCRGGEGRHFPRNVKRSRRTSLLGYPYPNIELPVWGFLLPNVTVVFPYFSYLVAFSNPMKKQATALWVRVFVVDKLLPTFVSC